MDVNKKETAPNSSAGTEEKQSPNTINEIITDPTEKDNIDRLITCTLEELYDNAFPPKKPIVENFLYTGTYLFVGAPKIGKSFLMAQLGYHISMGID